MADALVKLFVSLVGFAIIVALIIWAVMIAALVASLLLGLVSVYIVKSSRGLVKEQETGAALVMAVSWAAVLTVGCILGSLGLIAALNASFGSMYLEGVIKSYDVPQTGTVQSFWIFLDRWIIPSAYSFFGKTATIIFLANRIFVARQSGGSAWLGVVPPLFAMLVFFAVDHWDLVARAFGSLTIPDFLALMKALWAVIYLPVELLILTVSNPNAAIEWGHQKLVASNGSMFKLAELFPSVFWILVLAYGIKALVASATD